uniref:RRM domain-containing protein n=1 Tax=Panagrolaimus sp. JU765 TaxID=591449 RepID=A0AC34QDJ2_9BILA
MKQNFRGNNRGSFRGRNSGRYFENQREWKQNSSNHEPLPKVKSEPEVVPSKTQKKSSYGPRHSESNAGIKNWRLIVRNLDDNTTKDDLTEAFSKYGKLKEVVQIPSKIRKGKFAPYAFIQFVSKKDAENALKNLNGTMLKSRKITLAFAMDKDRYVTEQFEKKNEKPEVKEESESENELPKSDEEDTDIDFTDSEDDEDEDDGEDDEDEKVTPKLIPKVKIVEKSNQPFQEIEDLVESEDDSELEGEDDDADDDEEGEDLAEDESDVVSEEEQEPAKKKQKIDLPPKEKKSDVALAEGRVVFLKNLAPEMDDEEFKEEMLKFGAVDLAILCKFKGTDHSTGTGFVHFKQKIDADKLLEKINSDEGLLLFNCKVRGHRAVSKTDALEFKKPEKEPSDNRNLYLIRASFIRPGTGAANNMSAHDEKKRATLMQQMKTKLKLTTMFVSPTRLSIHNIPFNFRDADLKKMCFNSCNNKNANILECRIMHENTGVDAKGKPKFGKSKGFGFVEFAEHKDALACLKTMNNNPTLFTNEKRPIVEFSIENHVALNLKKRRVEEVKNSNQDLENTKKELRKSASKPIPKTVGKKMRKIGGSKNKGKVVVTNELSVFMESELLLLELAKFDSGDPDLDVEFVDALVQYYFTVDGKIVEQILKEIEKNPAAKGVPLLVAIGLRIAREFASEVFGQKMMQMYEEHGCKRMNTAKQLYFGLLDHFLDAGFGFDQDCETMMNMCLEELKDEKCNLFCRKEVEHFLGRLLELPEQIKGLEKLVNSIVKCEDSVILDGLARVLMRPLILNQIIRNGDFKSKLLERFQKVERAERNICRLSGAILSSEELSVDKLRKVILQFVDWKTRRVVLFETLTVLFGMNNQLLDETKKSLFEFFKTVFDHEIDYQLPFLESIFTEEEMPTILMELSTELDSSKNCSPESLKLFFQMARKTVKDEEKRRVFLEKLESRLRRTPHFILIPEILHFPGADEFFKKKAIEYLQSKDLSTFDAGLLILEALDKIGRRIDLDDPEKMANLVLEKVFQDDDLFLAKHATEFLCRRTPKFLSQKAVDIFAARTDRDIRILLLKAFSEALKAEGSMEPSAIKLISMICRSDDDAQVRKAALDLGSSLASFPDDLRNLLQISVEEYNSHRMNATEFHGDSKAQLDDLIASIKSKAHGCHDCIAKECY